MRGGSADVRMETMTRYSGDGLAVQTEGNQPSD